MSNQYKPGDEFWHNTHGRVMAIYSHPHDGALVVCERMQTVETDCDEHEYDGFEMSELIALPDRKWPYLGFTRACAHTSNEAGDRCTKCGSSLYVIPPERATGTKCSVCNEPQYRTPAGNTCNNGHGGAEPT